MDSEEIENCVKDYEELCYKQTVLFYQLTLCVSFVGKTRLYFELKNKIWKIEREKLYISWILDDVYMLNVEKLYEIENYYREQFNKKCPLCDEITVEYFTDWQSEKKCPTLLDAACETIGKCCNIDCFRPENFQLRYLF